jgi:hypothetical protein
VGKKFLNSEAAIPGLSSDIFPRLNLIYCVPDFVYENFKTNPVDPKSVAKETSSENAAAAFLKMFPKCIT